MNDGNTKSASYDNEDLVFLFRRASRMMARKYHRRAHSHHAQEHVLSIIRERGPIKQGDLLELLDVRSSSLSEVLGKLERNGLIERKRNEKDKRSFVISATNEATVPGTMPQGGGESTGTLFACLDDGERRQLGGILEKIIGSFQNDRLCRDAGDGECAFGKHHHNHSKWREKMFGNHHSGREQRGKQGKHESRGGRAGRGGSRTGEKS